MRLALLGDIHGNHLALAEVLLAAEQARVDMLLITGDLVGYYFWPGEVLDMLGPWEKLVVRGNHEDFLARALESDEILEQIDGRYGTGLRVAIESLSDERLAWLSGLPHPQAIDIEGTSILLCHGSPWDLDFYVYPDVRQGVLDRCADSEHDWIVLGHTHYPMAQAAGTSRIVNPGSVGQPRNRVPGAHWALLDTASGELSFRVEAYDPGPVIQAAVERNPDIPYLHQVLTRT